jgi:HD domain
MNTIAGVRIPDSALARDARALAREHSPDFLLSHVDRTFVFGALVAAGAGVEVQEELAYVGAILHDLGLTERFGGERRFEVDGAEAARSWALANGMSAHEAQQVWDAIALHASPGIADARSPECALVHWGAGVDVLGLGADRLDPAAIAAVHDALPRDGFAEGIARLLEAAARRSPSAYTMTWLSETASRCCGAPLPSFDSALRRDPFTPGAV